MNTIKNLENTIKNIEIQSEILRIQSEFPLNSNDLFLFQKKT